MLLLVSAACFCAMAIFGKVAFAAGVDTQTLLLVRFVLAAICLVDLSALSVLTGRHAAGGGRSGGGPPSPPRPRCGCCWWSSGNGLCGVRRAGGNALGVSLALGAAPTYTGYILIADRVGGYLPPVVLSAIVMSGASLTVLAWTLLGPGLRLNLSPAAWTWLALIAVVSTVVAMVTFLAGTRRTESSTAAILCTFEPVVTAALAALVLAETLSPGMCWGGALAWRRCHASTATPRPLRLDRYASAATPRPLHLGCCSSTAIPG